MGLSIPGGSSSVTLAHFSKFGFSTF